mmetsp:Transcript_43954/g.42537  ORF Transcript_43954/g.42537 Transcript_43954/m.42537 type:complete len:98 (+) Transcript_43954:147-440(+)
MAGGTEIMITGSKFNADADNNLLKFWSSDFSNTFDGPGLSHDNHFRSQTGNSKLQYTLPSLETLLGLTETQVGEIGGSIDFTLSIQNNEGHGQLAHL